MLIHYPILFIISFKLSYSAVIFHWPLSRLVLYIHIYLLFVKVNTRNTNHARQQHPFSTWTVVIETIEMLWSGKTHPLWDSNYLYYIRAGICTCTCTYTCFLLISMLWHRQAFLESKWDKLSSSAECRIRSWELNSLCLWWVRISTHDFTADWLSHLALAIYMCFVVNFDALGTGKRFSNGKETGCLPLFNAEFEAGKHTHTHTHIYIYIYTYACISMHIYMHISLSVQIQQIHR